MSSNSKEYINRSVILKNNNYLFNNNNFDSSLSLSKSLKVNKYDNDLSDIVIKSNINKNYECEICSNNEDELISYIECEDFYCRNCWFSYLKNKIENSDLNNIRCMNYN